MEKETTQQKLQISRIPKTRLERLEWAFRIKDKRGNLVPFKLNRAQLYYWKKKTRRNLIVKARQKGISKVIDADQLLECTQKDINAVIISHEKEATKRLFGSVRGFVENARAIPLTSIDSKTEMKFPETGSSYFIGTAGQKAFGRGDTVDRAHLSEAAFYEDLERILNGIAEACEYGQIDIETTPNGRNQIYDMVQKAKVGRSSYTFIFIPWFIDQEYSVDNFTEEERQGLSASVREMINIPDEKFMQQLTEEETNFKEKAEREWKDEGIVITPGMLKWRRYKIWDKGDMFFQEYPEDDVSCFLQTGRTVFSKIITLPTRKIPLDNIETWGTEAERRDLKNRRLYAGVDCAEGTLTGDSHVFSVVDIQDGKGVVIFEIHSNEPINVFCEKVARVFRQFNIQMGVEKNGVGVAHTERFKALGINIFEWETTAANRPTMITDLEEAYRKGDLIESYVEAENELRDMEYGDNNKAAAKKGKHDDRVMSRAVAWQIRKLPVPGISFV